VNSLQLDVSLRLPLLSLIRRTLLYVTEGLLWLGSYDSAISKEECSPIIEKSLPASNLVNDLMLKFVVNIFDL